MQNGVRHTNAVERELSSLSPNSFSFLKLSDPGKEGGVAAVCDMLQSIDTEILSLDTRYSLCSLALTKLFTHKILLVYAMNLELLCYLCACLTRK